MVPGRTEVGAFVIAVIYGSLLQRGKVAGKMTNIALGKKAATYYPMEGKDIPKHSMRAVDGSHYARQDQFCSVAEPPKIGGWHSWLVDLEDVYSINNIRLTPRQGYPSKPLNNFTIEVSVEFPKMMTGFPGRTTASVCMSRVGNVPTRGPIRYDCDHPVTGRYMRIVRYSTDIRLPLVICEFEAYGDFVRKDENVDNLALGKPTEMYSIPFQDHWGSSKAVDGSPISQMSSLSCVHGMSWVIEWKWWMVDLENVYTINYVRLTNRGDCCSDRLKNFTIEVSEQNPKLLAGFPGRTKASVCSLVHKVPTPGPIRFNCAQPVTGRYMRLVMYSADDKALNLCEFEAYGKLWSKEDIKATGTHEPAIQNEKHGNIRTLVYVTSKGPSGIENSLDIKHLVNACIRIGRINDVNINVNPYILTELPTGTCKFLKTIQEIDDSASPHWIVYSYIWY